MPLCMGSRIWGRISNRCTRSLSCYTPQGSHGDSVFAITSMQVRRPLVEPNLKTAQNLKHQDKIRTAAGSAARVSYSGFHRLVAINATKLFRRILPHVFGNSPGEASCTGSKPTQNSQEFRLGARRRRKLHQKNRTTEVVVLEVERGGEDALKLKSSSQTNASFKSERSWEPKMSNSCNMIKPVSSVAYRCLKASNRMIERNSDNNLIFRDKIRLIRHIQRCRRGLNAFYRPTRRLYLRSITCRLLEPSNFDALCGSSL
eukprot:284815388_2